MLTVERLKELLHYDPDTGEFVWKISRGGKRIGNLAGSIHKGHGYHQLRLDDHLYLSHRLAWLYMTGHWPKHEIDHINGVRIDNRFVNLREATRFQNFANRPKYACNKTGYKGVNWHKGIKYGRHTLELVMAERHI